MELINKILDLLNLHFQTIISILSIILGACAGYFFSTKTLKIQLEHDSKERKNTTRKEVYLQAVEKLSKANFYLGSLSNVNIQKTNISVGFQDLFISFSKLSLVAEEEIVKYFLKLEVMLSCFLWIFMMKYFLKIG